MAADTSKHDELVAATIRTAVDEWRIQNDPADYRGVSMPEYIRRALADAGLLVDSTKTETLGLSHVLLRKGVRGLLDQVDAMAQQIKTLQTQLDAVTR